MSDRQKRIALVTFLFVLVVAKFVVFQMFAVQPMGIQGDADQYHAYALHLNDKAYNLWSYMMGFFSDAGWYSRKGVAWVLLCLNMLAIPALAGIAAVRRNMPQKDYIRIGFAVAVLISLYPTLYFYSLDVYRDEFMMFVFVLCLAFIRRCLDEDAEAAAKAFWGIAAVTCIWVLYLLRPYLGVAVLLAVPLSFIFDISRARLCLWALAYLAALNVMFALGWLDRIAVHYRAIFAMLNGNTNLGIVFDNPWTFLFDFARSWLYQLPGLHFPKPLAWLVFILESVPFLAASWWLLKNRRYADRFVSFLVVFFFVYSTIWVLGNDNLGSAVRLRMFNYVAVLIACAAILGRKRILHRPPSETTTDLQIAENTKEPHRDHT